MVSEIRSANIEDLDSIYRLITELENHLLDFHSFEKIFLENLSNPQVYYYVYINKQNTVGFISLYIQPLLHHASKIAEIQELIVSKDVQGQGMGMKLFQKVVYTAKINECTQIEVSCNQKRKRSHTFYTNMGMSNNHFKFSMLL